MTVFLALMLMTSLALSACGSSITLEPPRSFYTDREVEAFVERFPSLESIYNEVPTPPDILEQLGIDTDLLRVVDRYVGDCLCFVVYDLSPSYTLVVDDNACSGYNVYVQLKEEN